MRTFWILALGLAAALLTGCGGGSAAETATTPAERPGKPQELSVTLDGWEGPGTAGILMAQERGYFADASLQVDSLVPATPDRSVEYVVDGTDDLGVTQEPQVVMAKERGAPIIIVGSLIPQPTAALIWAKKSGIRKIADLKGKTIAIPGVPFQRKFLEAILAQEGLSPGDVTIKTVDYRLVPALISGRADAIFGGTWNLEGVELESRGIQPVITRVQDLGVPAYDELVVIARADRVSEEPELGRDFMAAVARGTAAAVEDPEEVFNGLERVVEANPATSEKALHAQIEATVPLLSESGEVSPQQAQGLIDWMYEEQMIQRKIPVSELLTND
jgi:putative hydroxymethylpyrimidine transport system substrate-binding protein